MGNKNEASLHRGGHSTKRRGEQGGGKSPGAGLEPRAQEFAGHAPNCTADVLALVSALADLQGDELTSDLLSGAASADSVIALARARNMLDAEIARRLVAAAETDYLRTSAGAPSLTGGRTNSATDHYGQQHEPAWRPTG